MGQWFEFRCGQCGYEAEVSGGNDAGMFVTTTTVICRTCKKLCDVTTARMDLDGATPAFEPVEVRCPKAKRHMVERWTHPGPCPQCGETLERVGTTAIWD